MIDIAVFERQGNRRDEIIEIHDVYGGEDAEDEQDARQALGLQSFLGERADERDEEPYDGETYRAGEKKDVGADPMEDDRYDENGKRVDAKKEKAGLEDEPRVVALHGFVRDERDGKDDEERPARGDCAAAEIEDEIGAQEPAEEELHDVHEPELGLLRIFGERRLAAADVTRKMQMATITRCPATQRCPRIDQCA